MRWRLELNRHWRAFFIALCGVVVVGTLIVALIPSLSGLLLLALYCIPTNSVLPLPHEPGVLYFATFYDPLGIAIAATVGSIVVSFADYAMVEAAMRHPRLHAASNAGLFGWALRWMKRWPFVIVVLFSALPLPISIIRVLAPASGYPLRRYILAQVIGRIPRFYALAWLGQTVQFPTWVLLAMFGLLAVIFWTSSRSKSPDDETSVEILPEIVDDNAETSKPAAI